MLKYRSSFWLVVYLSLCIQRSHSFTAWLHSHWSLCISSVWPLVILCTNTIKVMKQFCLGLAPMCFEPLCTSGNKVFWIIYQGFTFTWSFVLYLTFVCFHCFLEHNLYIYNAGKFKVKHNLSYFEEKFCW